MSEMEKESILEYFYGEYNLQIVNSHRDNPVEFCDFCKVETELVKYYIPEKKGGALKGRQCSECGRIFVRSAIVEKYQSYFDEIGWVK